MQVCYLKISFIVSNYENIFKITIINDSFNSWAIEEILHAFIVIMVLLNDI